MNITCPCCGREIQLVPQPVPQVPAPGYDWPGPTLPFSPPQTVPYSPPRYVPPVWISPPLQVTCTEGDKLNG